MIVAFCGHREVAQRDDVRAWLIDCVESLIHEGATEFYLGGYGAFDNMAASVVSESKTKYPAIRSTLVLPYLDQLADMRLYDTSMYPPLEAVPRKYAIAHRNEWMIQSADVVVAYVRYGWGGAAKTLEYARKKKKRIIQYPD